MSSRGFFGGGEAEYIRLLVDGVPVADVESGPIDLAIVPASAIRRVEAVRGPDASLRVECPGCHGRPALSAAARGRTQQY